MLMPYNCSGGCGYVVVAGVWVSRGVCGGVCGGVRLCVGCILWYINAFCFVYIFFLRERHFEYIFLI